jgi:hypothetical protein
LKKLFFLATALLVFSWVNISWLPATPAAAASKVATHTDNSVEAEAASVYHQLGLEEKGLSQKAFEYAYKGYQRLLQKQLIRQPGYLTICDFSQSSNNKRLYLVDLANNEVVLNTYVAHGRNSGGEFATKFSNKPNSLQSSLGFYVTQNTYFGEHGLSLKIAGLEPGYNSNAMQRAVVIHGADYIGETWLRHSDYMGRSFGCPAVPGRESGRIINTIKDGTCLFIYHPSASYLRGSTLLNG